MKCKCKNQAIADTGAGLKLKRGLVDQTVDKGTKILLSVEVRAGWSRNQELGTRNREPEPVISKPIQVEGARPKTVKWYRGSEQVTSSSTTKVIYLN